MTTIIVDGMEIAAEQGTSVLKAALDNGIMIPHYCFHPALSVVGNCRLCMVEIEVQGRRQLATSCTNQVADGLVVHTNTPLVVQTRKDILEFLLTNHPLDCPVCDQAGECALQDYSFTYGMDRSRFSEKKVIFPRKDLGPHVRIYSTRCVRCTRCVRFCREVSGDGVIGYFGRGVHNEIGVFPGRALDNRLSGNVVDICPVGALIDRSFLFQARAWYLKGVDSICPRCSAGCNIRIDVKDEEVYGAPNVQPDTVYRIKPRINPDANRHWICDDGRYGVGYVNSASRLVLPAMLQSGEQSPTTWDEALRAVGEGLSRIGGEYGGDAIAVVSSGHLTNEEAYMASILARDVLGTTRIGIRAAVDANGEQKFPGGFVIETDKSPNSRGARDMAAALGLDLVDFSQVMADIEAGLVKAVYFIGGGPEIVASAEEIRSVRHASLLIVQDILPSGFSSVADIVLPSLSFAEKDGTWTNSRRRVQRIRRSIAARGEARSDIDIMANIAGALGSPLICPPPADLWREARQKAEGYEGASYEAIGCLGVQLGAA